MSIYSRIILALLAALALGANAIPAGARPIGRDADASFMPVQTTTSSSPPVPPSVFRVTASQLAKIDQAAASAAAKEVQYSNPETNAYADTATPGITTGVTGVAHVTPQTGFDWGAAGIGAAAGFALAMLAVGGALVVLQRRPRRGRPTTALSS
jgi:hypothetical protein